MKTKEDCSFPLSKRYFRRKRKLFFFFFLK
uniref:Uncharacterized protein n=1 Tax=Arabidopsis thaliana TaxID=3702 RepID=Q0WRF2_ARATH|nr:hypothetical protein [Arabidopsis thaliana]